MTKRNIKRELKKERLFAVGLTMLIFTFVWWFLDVGTQIVWMNPIMNVVALIGAFSVGRAISMK